MPSKRGTRSRPSDTRPYVRPTTVDVGHPINHQYKSNAKRHVVVKAGAGWVLLCTKGGATREHTGFLTKESVTCATCFREATEAVKQGSTSGV